MISRHTILLALLAHLAFAQNEGSWSQNTNFDENTSYDNTAASSSRPTTFPSYLGNSGFEGSMDNVLPSEMPESNDPNASEFPEFEPSNEPSFDTIPSAMPGSMDFNTEDPENSFASEMPEGSFASETNFVVFFNDPIGCTLKTGGTERYRANCDKRTVKQCTGMNNECTYVCEHQNVECPTGFVRYTNMGCDFCKHGPSPTEIPEFGPTPSIPEIASEVPDFEGSMSSKFPEFDGSMSSSKLPASTPSIPEIASEVPEFEGSMSSKFPEFDGSMSSSKLPAPTPSDPNMCCKAKVAKCIACEKGMTVEEFCNAEPGFRGCPSTSSTRYPGDPDFCGVESHVDCTKNGDQNAICVYGDHCKCSEGFECENGNNMFGECMRGETCIKDMDGSETPETSFDTQHPMDTKFPDFNTERPEFGGSMSSSKLPEPNMCCKAIVAKCVACDKGMTVEEFCNAEPGFRGCPTPSSSRHPEPHPETTGAHKCCRGRVAKCVACEKGLTLKEFCAVEPKFQGCPRESFDGSMDHTHPESFDGSMDHTQPESFDGSMDHTQPESEWSQDNGEHSEGGVQEWSDYETDGSHGDEGSEYSFDTETPETSFDTQHPTSFDDDATDYESEAGSLDETNMEGSFDDYNTEFPTENPETSFDDTSDYESENTPDHTNNDGAEGDAVTAQTTSRLMTNKPSRIRSTAESDSRIPSKGPGVIVTQKPDCLDLNEEVALLGNALGVAVTNCKTASRLIGCSDKAVKLACGCTCAEAISTPIEASAAQLSVFGIFIFFMLM